MHTSIHSEPPESPGIPARNGFTVYSVLSPAIGFLVTVALRKMARAPGRAQHTSARLDAGVEASGPHVFAVRISVARLRTLRSLTGETRPAIPVARTMLPRPPHPAPTFVTMANAPLSGAGRD